MYVTVNGIKSVYHFRTYVCTYSCVHGTDIEPYNKHDTAIVHMYSCVHGTDIELYNKYMTLLLYTCTVVFIVLTLNGTTNVTPLCTNVFLVMFNHSS